MCLVIQEAPWCKRLGQLPQWVSLVVSTCMGHESHETCRCACSFGSCSRNPLGTPGLSACTWHEGNPQGMLVSRSCPHCLRSSARASKNWRNHEKSKNLLQPCSTSVRALWKYCDSWFPFGRLGSPSNSQRVSPGNDQLASSSPAPSGWWNNTRSKCALQIWQNSTNAFSALVYDFETKRSSSSTERYGATLFEPQMFLLWQCIKHESLKKLHFGRFLERVKSLVFPLTLWYFTVAIWDACHVASISVSAVHIAHCTDWRSLPMIFSQCTNTFQPVHSQANLVSTSWKVLSGFGFTFTLQCHLLYLLNFFGN